MAPRAPAIAVAAALALAASATAALPCTLLPTATASGYVPTRAAGREDGGSLFWLYYEVEGGPPAPDTPVILWLEVREKEGGWWEGELRAATPCASQPLFFSFLS